jgi:hypothetical protein
MEISLEIQNDKKKKIHQEAKGMNFINFTKEISFGRLKTCRLQATTWNRL